jgi:hypothetical protein
MRELIKDAALAALMAAILGTSAGLVFVGALTYGSGCVRETLEQVLP